MDRRSNKTRKLLEEALIRLMVEKGFDKISIKDLTEAADINRGTFYLHYKDKYDLLEQKEAEILGQIAEVRKKIIKENTDIAFPSNRENLVSVFTQVYTYLKANADFMRVILGPNGDLNFQMKAKSLIEESLINIVTINSNVDSMTLKYASTMASSAQLGIIQKWLRTGMEESPEELAYFVSEVIYNLYNNVVVSFKLKK